MTGKFNTLMARDGHEFQAWLVAPAGRPRGAVVVLQEIFGVNSHIRAVTDGFAAAGYVAIAPCLFDRVRRGVELGYGAPQIEEGRGYVMQISTEKVLLDIHASVNVVKHAGAVGAVGYCWGGTLAHLAAAELPIRAAVAYYGSRIVENLQRTPRVPVQYHFGDRDRTLPPESIKRIQAADPHGDFNVYAADHGFNCDQRASFDAAATATARTRTFAFLAQHLCDTELPADNAGD
jgi:carboxymethylenebutenolidase